MQLPAISTEICLAAESNQRLQSKLHDFALGLATGSLECIFHQFVIDEDGHAHGRVNTFRSRIEIVVQRHTERYRPSGRLDATRHPLNIAQSPARLAKPRDSLALSHFGTTLQHACHRVADAQALYRKLGRAPRCTPARFGVVSSRDRRGLELAGSP